MSSRQIGSDRLAPSDIPDDDAGEQALIDFAHTFDGYAHRGSSERCAEIANGRDHSSLDALRTCLFFEARRWRHSGESPDDRALAHWGERVAGIRTHRLSRAAGPAGEAQP